MGVLIHVLCDAANNLGVIAAALVIWLAKYDGRYYADPGVSMGIALMIMLSSIPLGKRYLPHEIPEYAAESLFFFCLSATSRPYLIGERPERS